MDIPEEIKKIKMPWMTGNLMIFILGMTVMGTIFFLNLRATQEDAQDLRLDFDTFLEEEFDPFKAGEDNRFNAFKEELT